MIACRVPVSRAKTGSLDPVWLVRSPIAVSRNTLAAPAVVNSSIRTLADCPSVVAIAYSYSLPPFRSGNWQWERSAFSAPRDCCEILEFCAVDQATIWWPDLAIRDTMLSRKVEPSVEGELKKKLNRDQQRARKAGELAVFMRQYARKAQRGVEPNDRQFDRGIESAVKRMPADELDRLLREDDDGMVHQS